MRPGDALLAAAGVLAMGCGNRGPEAAPGDPFAVVSEEHLTTELTRATERAARSNKRVLLEFIADWCTDCREVVRISGLEPARSVLRDRYEVIHVNVGRFDRHRALIERHGVDRIARLVVLDGQGAVVGSTTLEPVTGGAGLTPERLAEWLRAPRLAQD
jgi:thiol:disulfide interchange protein